jgi:hypothetical protein
MDDKQLKRTIRSIGMSCFVKYFEQYQNMAISNEDLIELLKNNEGYTDIACGTRVAHSRRIIRADRGADALLEITQSTKLEYDIIAKAKKLLQKYYPKSIG